MNLDQTALLQVTGCNPTQKAHASSGGIEGVVPAMPYFDSRRRP